MRKRLRACAVCSAGPTGQLCRFSAHSVGFRRPQSCHVPIERKAVTAAMTNPYSPLWVSTKVPSLGSGASPFSDWFLVPPPATLSTRSLSPSHLCLPDSVPCCPDPTGVLHQKNQGQTDPCCSLLSSQGIPVLYFWGLKSPPSQREHMSLPVTPISTCGQETLPSITRPL